MKLFYPTVLAALTLSQAVLAQYNGSKNLPDSITIPLPSSQAQPTPQQPSYNQAQVPSGYPLPPNQPVPSYTGTPTAPPPNQDLSQVMDRLNQLEQTVTQMQQQQQQTNQKLNDIQSSTNWYVQPPPGQPSEQDKNPFQLHPAP